MHPIKWQVLPLGQINFLDCKIIKYNQERGSGATCPPAHNSNKPTSEDFLTKLDINELQILETNYIKQRTGNGTFKPVTLILKPYPV